jgi:hypothetical protein
LFGNFPQIWKEWRREEKRREGQRRLEKRTEVKTISTRTVRKGAQL